VTGDENWAHHYDPENESQSMEYCHKGSAAPKKFKTKTPAGKVMLIVFQKSEGVVLNDFREKGATVNSKCYNETLKKSIMRKGAEIDNILLQQDNSRPHTSAATTDVIAHMGFTVLPNPAYSSDLGPSNFQLFPKLKKDLRGHNFSSDEEVKAVVHQWFWEKEKDFFNDGI
jgi:hypothetical protein